MSNLATFDRQRRAEEKRVVAEASEAIRSFTLQLHRDLLTDAKETGGAYGSPIASGRLVASMRVSINAVDNSTAAADPNYQYPEGSGPRPLPPRTIANPAIRSVAARLRLFKLGDVIYIANSVPYIRRIEFEGWSWQAPFGVFQRTVDRAVSRFRNARIRVLNG